MTQELQQPPQRIPHYHMRGSMQTACVCMIVKKKREQGNANVSIHARLCEHTRMHACMCVSPDASLTFPPLGGRMKSVWQGEGLLCRANVIAEISIVIHLA